MHGKLILLAALAAGISLLPKSASSAPGGATTAQGSYSAAQAEAGAALYATHCVMCHGKDLEGTYEIPTLKGRFLGNWGHAPLGRLFDYVSRAMPQFSPGSLSPEDNAAIVAYILKQNGMPAGTKPLATDAKALDAITIEPAKH
jgi:mono/diheme cytochrome c family protein